VFIKSTIMANLEECIEDNKKWDIDMRISEEELYGSYSLGQFANPSGKYYTPWANSNVNGIEAARDSVWWEALEWVAEEHDVIVMACEGDPTVTLLVIYNYVEEEENNE